MKFKKISLAAVCICLLFFIQNISAKPVQAAVTSELAMSEVSDILQIKGDIPYQNITLSSTSLCATYKISLKKSGMIKIITNASDVSASYITLDGTTVVHNLKVVTRIFQNAACVNQIGSDAAAYRNQNSDTGAIFLEAGDYYVQFEGTDPSESSSTAVSYLNGTVSAGVFYQKTSDSKDTVNPLTLTQVNDIERGKSTQSYQNINLSNTTKSATGKITLTGPGAVKLITNASGLTQSSTENGVQKTLYPRILTSIYQNAACTRQIGKNTEAVSSKASETETVYLEKGTYYVKYYAPDVTPDAVINGTLTTAVYYQPYKVAETVTISSQKNTNALSWTKVQKGFLSDISNEDFYKFTVKDLRPLKVWCRTYQDGKTQITLYNSSFEKIAQASGKGSMELISLKKYVKKGTYYVKITSSAKGAYEIRLAKQSSYITLSYKMPVVTVKTVSDYQEIRYLKGDYYETNPTAKIWNKGTVLRKNAKSFSVNKKGYYTVRVIDNNGNKLIKMIYISKADQKKPGKPSVSNCKAMQYSIRGTAEKNSTVYAKINTYSNVYKAKVSSKGNYHIELDYYLMSGDTIKVYAVDKAGNKGAVRKIKVR